MKKKNGGFSLVELIVVIAIISALAGLVIIGIGSVTGFKANACAEKIYGYMNDAKTSSLGFENVEMKLYYADNTYKADVRNAIGNVGEKSLSVKFTLEGDASQYDLKTNELYISFDRASGAFKKCKVKQSDGSEITDKYLDKIIISQNSTTRTIECISITGKFTLE